MEENTKKEIPFIQNENTVQVNIDSLEGHHMVIFTYEK